MATIYVTEFATIAVMQAGRVTQVPQWPPLAQQAIAITASTTQTAAFNAKTSLIRVHTDAICAINIDVNPVAVVAGGGSGSARMVAGQTEYEGAAPGWKLAVISTT